MDTVRFESYLKAVKNCSVFPSFENEEFTKEQASEMKTALDAVAKKANEVAKELKIVK